MAYAMIPLTCTPFVTQDFKITLKNRTINKNIKLVTYYLDLYDAWLADIYDNATDECLVTAVPLVCGVNILGQFDYLGLGEAFIESVSDSTTLEHPDNKTLGSEFVLIWGDDSDG